MLYNITDLRVLKDEIEFIDTAIVPLVNIDFNNEVQNNANNLELMQFITIQLEKQLKGRLMITPVLTLIGDNYDNIEEYKTQLLDYGFKNIVLLSFTALELDDVSTIKVNSIPISDMDNDMKLSIINDEVKSVIKEIILVWNK
ncbi:DUF2487 family protein [Jeotgalicoccus meleagridis]|uniref:DUF2487 family protein n=1 Tax=Jeotgalicoccus meleagridis TaxID=2759181 RepID=A0A6V7RI23_9STAP|nr:DUF2487 family protein [Jeotgalicoccus meleagridis]CAD2077723.1 hypothetical protein JEODO184_01226 [Jeotgalicoccus meleagridis]HIW37975.1 YpiF family protein [Candidatus Jeotgalicoccus stercoravium]